MSYRSLICGLILLLACVSLADASKPWVVIMAPHDGASVMGEVEMEVRVGALDGVDIVEFQLDGRPVGSLSQPPYRFIFDLGADNEAHSLGVVVRDADGEEATAQVGTKPLPIAAEFSVDLQQLYVTVSADEARVLDLDGADFEVQDEGDRQELVTFARGDIPFTASILIDASASMQGDKLLAAVAGARSFLDGMQELDQMQLTVFSDTLLIHTPIGAGREVMLAGLGWITAQGGTAIADHLWASLELLQTRQGRRVAVLLSDGIDTHSVLPMEAVLDAARHSQALIYWIRLVRADRTSGAAHAGALSSAWRDSNGYRKEGDVLEKTVTESGGRIVEVTSPDDIEAVFLTILDELREQYVLGYYPTARRRDGSWHKVKVKVGRGNGLDVRAGRGYVDR